MMNDDLQLARMLLNGFVEEDSHGRPHSKYFEEGSAEETEARKALARILRSNNCLDRQLRTHLAELFDIDPPFADQRKIKIVYRKGGNPRDHVANTHLAEQIYQDVRNGKTVNEAIALASAKFDVSEDNIKKNIWKFYRPVLERINGPLPRPARGRSKV